MSMMQTYHGVVRKGRILITPPTDFPEGSEVYVVVIGQTELIFHCGRRSQQRHLPF